MDMGGQAPTPAITVLVHEWVTGGGLAGAALPGSWATEGRAMRRALAADFAGVPGVRVVMTLDDRLPDEPGPWTLARIGTGAEAARFLALATAADYTLVIAPETDGILEARARVLATARAQSLGAAPNAIGLAADKAKLGALWRERGIPTPDGRRVVPSLGLPADAAYPAVLKPIDGAGSVNTYLIDHFHALPPEARCMPEALLQPFLAGVPMSASVLVGADGVVRLIGVGRQRTVIDKGRFVYQGGTLPADRAAFTFVVEAALAVAPGLKGFVGIDYLWDEDARSATVLEINPRPTTSYVGLARLLGPGRLAGAWLDTLSGRASFGRYDLADAVHSRHPIRFFADGTIRGEEEGPHP